MEKEECYGYGNIFRYTGSSYISKSGFATQERYRLMKKMSCNCDKCRGLLDYANDALCDELIIKAKDIYYNDLCYLWVDSDGYFEFRKHKEQNETSR